MTDLSPIRIALLPFPQATQLDLTGGGVTTGIAFALARYQALAAKAAPGRNARTQAAAAG